MGQKYATILVGGDVPNYADGSIPDDGSQVEANRVKYATITTDLSNPLHVGIQNMDAKLVAHVNEGPDTENGTVTLTAADHNKVLECTGSFTLSLLNPTGNAGFQCTVKNAGSGTVTVNVDGGANIDGGSSISLLAGEAAKVYVNNAGTAYYSVTGNKAGNEFPSGTIMIFEQNDAPTGWTKKTAAAYNNVALRVSTGTVTDVTSGSVDFDTVFGITATDAHTLSIAEMPAHDHTGSVVPGAINTGGYDGNVRIAQQNTNLVPLTIASQGGGGGHSHDIDLQVRYRDVIIAEKD